MNNSDVNDWRMSVCPYCGVGCGMEIGVRDGAVVAVRGMESHPINRGALCHLARNLIPVLGAEDRLLRPMIRKTDEGFLPVSWDAALDAVASGISRVIQDHGPDAVALYVSASEHIEEYYVYNKLMKGALGTNNIESSARLCWSSGVAGLVDAFGSDSPPCAIDDLDHADLLFVAGYDPAASKPVFFQRLLQARAKTGARLLVIDPRRTKTATRADRHLSIEPGTDVVLHNAIAHVLFEEGWIDEGLAGRITDDVQKLKHHVAGCTPQQAAEICGLCTSEIVNAARELAEAKAALFMWGQGLNQSRIGTRKVSTLLNLALITGNVGRPGAGPLAVTGQSGAMSLREVGALPNLLPGFRSVTNACHRAEIAEIWGVDPARLSSKKGRTISGILEGIESGHIKVLWIIHSNPAATFPDSRWTNEVLAKTPLLIVQDCYHPTETSALADILLPAAQWAEKGGTLTNSERGMNLLEAAVTAPGEARPDLEIVIDVAQRLGHGEIFDYSSTEAIFEEFKRCTVGRANDLSGLTYDRLRRDRGIQWPVPDTDHPGTARRFSGEELLDGLRLSLGIHDHLPPAEPPDAEYPLNLITGLNRIHFHSRTRTGKVGKLHRAAPEPHLDIHPDDAARYVIRDGARARVTSRRGSILVQCHVTDSIRAGSVFLPYHFGSLGRTDDGVNCLTIRAFDERAGQPEYKACAVRVSMA